MATTTVAPILIQQMNKNYYVGFGSLHTIQDAVDAAVASGHPSLVIIPQGYWGTDQISDVVNGTDWIYLTDNRGWNPFYYLWEANQYRGPFINLSGSLTEDTTLDLNGNDLIFSGAGTTYIGGTDPTTATVIQNGGNLSAPNITTPNLTAPNASFDNALVNGSPVRTFENTGDPGTGVTYPPAGLVVSTGSGWGTSIPPATFLPVAGGTMTGLLNLQNSAAPRLRLSYPGMTTNQTINEIQAEQWGGLQFSFVSDDGTTSVPWLIATRNGTTPTGITLNAPLYIQSNTSAYGDIVTTGMMQVLGDGNGFTSISGGSYPGLNLVTYLGAPDSQIFQILQYPDNLQFRFIDGSGNGYYWLQVSRSGASAVDLWFSAPLNAPAKNFVIQHPADERKVLTHSCLEGPEHAVFYRGEGKTVNGIAEITLPDYFEALTLKDGRTVQVTPLIEEDNAAFSPCSATRVKDGKFRVCSTAPSQGFYWEVQAIRSDLPPLEVIRDRESSGDSNARKTKQ